MIRKNRLAVAAAALAALAVTGAATTASGAPATPGPTKAAEAAKAPESTKTASPDVLLIAAAAALGVTPAALDAAIVGAKQSFADAQTSISDADFTAAVAGRLGLPAAQVSEALQPLFAAPKHDGGTSEDKDRKHAEKPDGPSPLTTESAAQVFAASAGVTVDQARAALATIATIDGRLETDSEQAKAIAAGLGITTDQLIHALRQVKVASIEG
jgi:hypothetical protein